MAHTEDMVNVTTRALVGGNQNDSRLCVYWDINGNVGRISHAFDGGEGYGEDLSPSEALEEISIAISPYKIEPEVREAMAFLGNNKELADRIWARGKIADAERKISRIEDEIECYQRLLGSLDKRSTPSRI